MKCGDDEGGGPPVCRAATLMCACLPLQACTPGGGHGPPINSSHTSPVLPAASFALPCLSTHSPGGPRHHPLTPWPGCIYCCCCCSPTTCCSPRLPHTHRSLASLVRRCRRAASFSSPTSSCAPSCLCPCASSSHSQECGRAGSGGFGLGQVGSGRVWGGGVRLDAAPASPNKSALCRLHRVGCCAAGMRVYIWVLTRQRTALSRLPPPEPQCVSSPPLPLTCHAPPAGCVTSSPRTSQFPPARASCVMPSAPPATELSMAVRC